jgi:hypothetical protein
VRLTGVTALVLAALLLATGCSDAKVEPAARASAPATACKGAALRSWQRLADRIDAPVYCPGWLPDPLTPLIRGRWNNINSVDRDRSYLESFVWQETGPGAAGGELHVNLRAYPGRTAIPRCTQGGGDDRPIPCFSDARATRTIAGIRATLYTVNQDADQWHLLYLWRRDGTLYTLSEHLAPPLDYRRVVRNLDRMLKSLVLVRPAG